MDNSAYKILEKLLSRCEKHLVGKRKREASVTAHDLKQYRALSSLHQKEIFEVTIRDAEVQGAIVIEWDDNKDKSGFICKVLPADIRALSKFLGITLQQDKLKLASKKLSAYIPEFPVLNEILQQWSTLSNARGLSPDKTDYFIDAIKAIKYCYEQIEKKGEIVLPIREASVKLFNSSKKLEKLVLPIDILLTNSIEAKTRTPEEVWHELGLLRQEHPVRLSGNVIIQRERLSAYIDTPYIGLHANTILKLESIPKAILTIENLTTFHSEARKGCNNNILIIYTAGMPSPSWCEMYGRLIKDLPSETNVYHWGDIDEGGFRIAYRISQTTKKHHINLQPYKMHPSDIPKEHRIEASQKTLDKIKYFTDKIGWNDLGEDIFRTKIIAEQESI